MNRFLEEFLENFKRFYEISPLEKYIKISKSNKGRLKIDGSLLNRVSKNSGIILYKEVEKESNIFNKVDKLLSKHNISYVELNLKKRKIIFGARAEHTSFKFNNIGHMGSPGTFTLDLPISDAEDFINNI